MSEGARLGQCRGVIAYAGARVLQGWSELCEERLLQLVESFVLVRAHLRRLVELGVIGLLMIEFGEEEEPYVVVQEQQDMDFKTERSSILLMLNMFDQAGASATVIVELEELNLEPVWWMCCLHLVLQLQGNPTTELVILNFQVLKRQVGKDIYRPSELVALQV
ncbi:hypothetical protein Droror1_Dr00026800 [Drosera rotundifolia]